MTTSKAGSWIGGAAFAALVVMLAAWFLAISPTLTTASETRVESAAQRDQNALTEVKIDRLATQFATLDEIKAELAAVQLQIPISHDLAVFQRQVAAIALAHQVTIVSVTISPASALAPPVAAVATTDTSESESTTDSTDGESGAVPTAAAPVGSSGLFAVATSIDVLGHYQDVVAFLQDLQTGIERLFLVESFTATGQLEAAASAGRPAISPGDLELVIGGSVYALAPMTPALDLSTPDDVAPALPVPDAAKNPFISIG